MIFRLFVNKKHTSASMRLVISICMRANLLKNVIRTFFQLDVNTLESSLPEGVLEQLQEGIRIQDKDEYDSVISTFSDFAVDETHHLLRNGG